MKADPARPNQAQRCPVEHNQAQPGPARPQPGPARPSQAQPDATSKRTAISSRDDICLNTPTPALSEYLEFPVYFSFVKGAGSQPDSQPDSQPGRLTDKQTGRQTERQLQQGPARPSQAQLSTAKPSQAQFGPSQAQPGRARHSQGKCENVRRFPLGMIYTFIPPRHPLTEYNGFPLYFSLVMGGEAASQAARQADRETDRKTD